jgi:hypothetical protein
LYENHTHALERDDREVAMLYRLVGLGARPARAERSGQDQMRQNLAAIAVAEHMLPRQIYLVLLAEVAGHVGQVKEGLRCVAEALTALEASGRGYMLADG